MKVKIIERPGNSSIWYWDHIGDIIEVKQNQVYKELYDVIGPKEYLEKIKKRYYFDGFSVDVVHTLNLRKEKIKRIIANQDKK